MTNKFNLTLYSNPKTYQRNGLKAYFEPIRKILVPKTPEEEVRIKFVEYLITEMNIPEEILATEYPLRKNRGRVDIVGFYPDAKKRPLFIVECKAPNKFLTDDVKDQAVKYDEILKAGLFILTRV